VEGTLDHLLTKHFPADPNRMAEEVGHEPWHDLQQVAEVVDEAGVKRAIDSFGLYKSAGPDEIFPAIPIPIQFRFIQVSLRIQLTVLKLNLKLLLIFDTSDTLHTTGI